MKVVVTISNRKGPGQQTFNLSVNRFVDLMVAVQELVVESDYRKLSVEIEPDGWIATDVERDILNSIQEFNYWDGIVPDSTQYDTDEDYLAACKSLAKSTAKARLEYLRGELDAEQISTDGLLELQSLVPFIDPDDVQLLEAAGVPEFPEDED